MRTALTSTSLSPAVEQMSTGASSRTTETAAQEVPDYTQKQFHLDISELLLRAAPSAATFSCLRTDNVLSYSFLRRSHMDSRWGERQWLSSLRELVPLSWAAVLDSGRRTRTSSELGFPWEQVGSFDFLNTKEHVLVLLLFSRNSFHGLVGMERTASEPGFSTEERRRVESLTEMVSVAARLQVTSASLACETAALRALGSGEGLLLMADEGAKTIFWASRPERELDWQSHVAPMTGPVLEAAVTQLAGTPSWAGHSRIVGPRIALSIDAAEVDGSGFDVARSIAIRVRRAQPAEPAMELSKRERQVAGLLLEGYASLNIAAITGLSENTIRTYVRRLYHKLGVCNRLELVQAMCPSRIRSEGSPRL